MARYVRVANSLLHILVKGMFHIIRLSSVRCEIQTTVGLSQIDLLVILIRIRMSPHTLVVRLPYESFLCNACMLDNTSIQYNCCFRQTFS